MTLGFLVALLPPALAWLAQQLFPEKRILGPDPSTAAVSYFFGVVAALAAVTIARP
jgi:hypothetical protein